MESFWLWATTHWTSAFVLMIVALVLGFEIIHGIFVVVPNRILRHFNIKERGWPPPHCDADGDFKDNQ